MSITEDVEEFMRRHIQISRPQRRPFGTAEVAPPISLVADGINVGRPPTSRSAAR